MTMASNAYLRRAATAGSVDVTENHDDYPDEGQDARERRAHPRRARLCGRARELYPHGTLRGDGSATKLTIMLTIVWIAPLGAIARSSKRGGI